MTGQEHRTDTRPAESDSDPLIVATEAGLVRGFARSGVRVWRGVRYGAPAVAGLRWRRAQPPVPWTDVCDATQYGTRSLQERPAGLPPFPGGDGDAPDGEDCLFVNVCAPAEAAREPGGLPVVVWFHGGGFHFGSGADMIGDGEEIARSGVVVVSVNYRLGALGFLFLSDVLGDDWADSENCGLSDQIAALAWVKRNIAGFGGDPTRVTIAGVSAGAKSIANLLGSPAATGLFHGAISDSGGDHTGTREQAIAVRNRFVSLLGVRVADLPAVPASDLIAAQRLVAPGMSTWVWRAMTGTRLLPVRPTQAIAAGSAIGVPVLAGTARDEAGLYDDGDGRASAQAPAVLAQIFGASASRVFTAYAVNRPESSERQIRRAFMGDERYGIPTIRLLEAQAAHGRTWRWRFDGPVPDRTGHPRPGYHGDATAAFWRNTVPGGAPLHDAWLAFIRSGSPGPGWSEYADQRSTLIVGESSTVVHDPDSAERRCWEGVEWQPGPWWADAP